MTQHEDNCQMAERIVKLETKQDTLIDEFDNYKIQNNEAITKNTEAINKLSEIVIEHNTLLQQGQKKESNIGSVIGGIVTGVVTAGLIALCGIIF